MMNKSLFALVPEIDLSKEYAKTLSHDSLYAKFAAICGKIVFIPKQTMSYRRHEENVTRNTYRKKSVSHIIKRVFELDELARVHSQIYNQSLIAIAMLRHVPLTSEQHDVINEIESCIKNGGMRELVFLHDHHVILGGVIENIGRKLILLSGLHKKYLLKEDMYGYGK